jgi:hypothetical protein
MRPLILTALGALVTLVTTGCQSPHPFATPDASWKSHVGQLKHTNAKRVLVGDVVVQQRGPQEFQLNFLKGGSFPLISIRQDAVITRAEGLLANGHWQGAPAAAPKPLRPWLALREALAQPRGNPPGAPTDWQGDAQYEHGQLRTLSLTFAGDDQRFMFQFDR